MTTLVSNFPNKTTFHVFKWITESGCVDVQSFIVPDSGPQDGHVLFSRETLADVMREMVEEELLENAFDDERPNVGEVWKSPEALWKPILVDAFSEVDWLAIADALLDQAGKWFLDNKLQGLTCLKRWRKPHPKDETPSKATPDAPQDHVDEDNKSEPEGKDQNRWWTSLDTQNVKRVEAILPLLRRLCKEKAYILSTRFESKSVLIVFSEQEDVTNFIDIMAVYEEGESLYQRIFPRDCYTLTTPPWEFGIQLIDLGLLETFDKESGQLAIGKHSGLTETVPLYVVEIPIEDLPIVEQRLKESKDRHPCNSEVGKRKRRNGLGTYRSAAEEASAYKLAGRAIWDYDAEAPENCAIVKPWSMRVGLC
jgi:hypothetical protein